MNSQYGAKTDWTLKLRYYIISSKTKKHSDPEKRHSVMKCFRFLNGFVTEMYHLTGLRFPQNPLKQRLLLRIKQNYIMKGRE